MTLQTYPSPCGNLHLGVSQGHVCLCHWKPRPGDYEGDAPLMAELCAQLSAYFRGELRAFNLPLLPAGTPFQRTVWQAIAEVPYGQTISYKQLAQRIGRPNAIRAVANATGANPLAIIIPCHRIIGSDGSLTGFAGGLYAKRFLLTLEAGH